jgi:RES domain-containing protein
MRVWRLCRARHAATAFSGDGARLASARWNSEGVAMAYAAESLSLAVLEVFVHLTVEERPQDFVSVCAEIAVDGRAIEKAKRGMLARLSANWRFDHSETHAIGDEWALGQKSLLLPIPSVIIDGEWNALVNPEHPDARRIKVVETKPFRFDERMFKK